VAAVTLGEWAAALLIFGGALWFAWYGSGGLAAQIYGHAVEGKLADAIGTVGVFTFAVGLVLGAIWLIALVPW
jgi:Na+-driven multidrug efflux pump